MSVYCTDKTDKDYTRKVALTKQEWWKFCQYQVDRKIACVGAREIHEICNALNKDRSTHLLKSGSYGEQR